MPRPGKRRSVEYLHIAYSLALPTFGGFLCFVWVVVRPLSDLGGQFAFLCYTAYLLFFFPIGHLADQLEAAVLNIVSLAIGLGWSVAWIAISASLTPLYGPDSNAGRAALAVGLASLAFICGIVRSWSPRLNIAARIPLFISIFVMTSVQDVTRVSSRYFTDTFYVALFACAFSLLSTLLLCWRSPEKQLFSLFSTTISTVTELLPLSLHLIIDCPLPSSSTQSSTSDLIESRPHPRIRQSALAHSFKGNIENLGSAYHEFTISILRSRVPPRALKSVLKTIRKIGRNPLLGELGHLPGERIKHVLERTHAQEEARHLAHEGWLASRGPSRAPSRAPTPPSDAELGVGGTMADGTDTVALQSRKGDLPMAVTGRNGVTGAEDLRDRQKSLNGGSGKRFLVDESDRLVSAVCGALRVAESALGELLGQRAIPNPGASVRSAHTDLESILHEFQSGLYGMLDQSFLLPSASESGANHDRFRLAFHMTSLLDLSKDVSKLLSQVLHLVTISTPRRTLHFPIPMWNRKPHNEMLLRPRAGSGTDDVLDTVEDDEELKAFEDLDFVHATLAVARRPKMHPTTMAQRMIVAWREVWDHPKTVNMRVGLSRAIHHVRHSRHVLYAIKLSGGISLLSLPAFMPPGNPGRVWFQDFRGVWAVISYLYVLEMHTGAILKIGLFRLIGTFGGAVAAYVCTLIARDNPYALVVLATTCSVPIHYLIQFTAYPVIGLVGGITLPPLLFLRYLGLAVGESDFKLAWCRFVDIVIGITAAVLVGLLVWPNHARVKYFSAVSGTIDRLMEYCKSAENPLRDLRMSRDNLRHSLVYQDNQRHYDRLDGCVRRSMAVCRNLVDIQQNELSLLPRPTRLYGEVLDTMDRMTATMQEIRSLRSSLPRKETVLDVLPIRQEVASAMLINLWACAQSFRSRAPLPQYLASPRRAIAELMETIEDHARRIQPRSSDGSHRLAVLYAMAENEALVEVCNNVEELVAAARTLFGTQSFMDSRGSGAERLGGADPEAPPP